MKLKPERRPIERPRIATYDLEWIPHSLEIRVVGFYDGDSYRDFGSIDAFLNAILTPKYAGVWIYAHAGGSFDVQFVLDRISEREQYEVFAHFAGSSAIIVEVRSGRNRWIFLDSYYLLKAPLRKIAKMIGRDKGGVEDTGKNREEIEAYFRDTPIAELRDYNQGDCVNLYDAIQAFAERLRSLGGELRMTLAACAMGLFRRKYLKHTIPIVPSINEAARAAYTASRCEVLNKVCKSGFDYDINSSFPAAMLQPQPGKAIRRLRGIPPHGPFLLHARFTVPEVPIPPLPYRMKKTRRIYFPWGTWEGWITDIDLDLLRSVGGDVDYIHESILFEPIHDLAGYATTLYEMRRRANDEALKYILKILLNSLYGKFAERAEKTSLLINPAKRPQGAEMLKPGVFLVREEKNVAHAHVPLACQITSIARRALYEQMMRCKEIYYCDTDGFVAGKKDVLEVSDKLGDLKREAIVKSGMFLAPKLYTIEKTDGKRIIKAKGFSKISFKEFTDLAESRTVEVERMIRIRENLRRHSSLSPLEILVPKRMRSKDQPKRNFSKSGASVPWHVDDLETE